MRFEPTWRSSTQPRSDAARGKPGLDATVERFRFFNEVLEWHAHGEEIAIFTALEDVAPSVAEAYEKDHRGLDAAFDGLNNAVSVRDALENSAGDRRRSSSTSISPGQGGQPPLSPHQGTRLGARPGQGCRCHGQHRPEDRFPELVAWMYPLLSHDDRENMTRIWQHVMPADGFTGAVQLVHRAIGDDFAELARRIPGLTSESEIGADAPRRCQPRRPGQPGPGHERREAHPTPRVLDRTGRGSTILRS